MKHDLVPLTICLTIIVVAIVGGLVYARSSVSAARRYPSPRRQLSNDRQYYRAWRYRNATHTRRLAFKDMALPPPETAPPPAEWIKEIADLVASVDKAKAMGREEGKG